MRMGLVENDVFAKMLRILADPYNVLRMLRLIAIHTAEFLESVTNCTNANKFPNVLQTLFERSDYVANACRFLSFVTYSQAL